MANYAVFASGRGTNFVHIHSALKESGHRLACLVTDRPDCPAAQYARENDVPVIGLDYRRQSKPELEESLVTLLRHLDVELCVLAGFMRLLSPVMVDAFPRQIINIHPSLLPKYPGAGAIEKSFRSGDTIAGITIHYVDYGMDTGPIIIQKKLTRDPAEELERFEARIHSLEHQAYPQVVRELLDAREDALRAPR